MTPSFESEIFRAASSSRHIVSIACRRPPTVEVAAGRDERGPLEPRGVGPVDHDLPHHLDLVDRARLEQQGQLERRLERLRVQWTRGLLVHLDEAVGGSRFVGVEEAALGLEGRRRVDCAILPARSPKSARERMSDLLRQLARAGAEQLARRELLVNLETHFHGAVLPECRSKNSAARGVVRSRRTPSGVSE